MRKPLPNLDEGHPFYSDKAIKAFRKRIKILEEEERLTIRSNRKKTKDLSLEKEDAHELQEVTRTD